MRLLLLVVSMVTFGQLALAQVCPWDDPDLEKWSEPTTWPSGQIPQEMDDVVIPEGKKIVLDTQVPRFQTVTVDGVLVWGDVADIRVETRYILVNGEFHIGSEECKFEKYADIFLYGFANTTVGVNEDFGTKFIAANYDSRLEIHGKEKLSWTKLVETIGPNNATCGKVYDSWDELFDKENQEGLNAVIWNPDGTVYDYAVSATESGDEETVENFAYLMGNLTMYGKVVAIAVKEDSGTPQAHWEPLYQALENMGATQIRGVNAFDAYAFITVTGHPDVSVEMHVPRQEGDEEILTAKVDFTLQSRNLVFSAESATAAPGSSKYHVRFQVTSATMGMPMLTVLDDVSTWLPGDQVVIASTDFDWKQAEEKTLVECLECSNYQFRVDGAFEYEHYGRVTFGVDERAEVGLLSRNIRIEGEVQKECYAIDDHDEWLCERFERDTFGGHLRVFRGAFARVEGAQLYHMGQQRTKGNYPLHWHMCDEVPGQYFKRNTIHDSFSRCVTVHGTDNATVEDNVCYKHLGHGIFLEDSAERWNTIHHNLILGTMHGSLLLSDRKESDCDGRDVCNLLTSFWITRPENFVTDNVAAGGDGNGYGILFADVPLGPSDERQRERGLWSNGSAQLIKFELFTGNVAHGQADNGLWFDSRISYGQYHDDEWIDVDGLIWMNALYAPVNSQTGEYEDTVLSGLTFYRNDDFDAWIRGGSIRIENSTFADTITSFASAHTTGETYCGVRHSLFIGQTENKGQPFTYVNDSSVYDGLPDDQKPTHYFDHSIPDKAPEVSQSGIWMYQGAVFVYNCYFDQYYNTFYNDSWIDLFGIRPVHVSAAISFHKENNYPLVPRSGVDSLKWGYCDGVNNAWRLINGNETSPHWEMDDGSGMVNFHDYDGSLTGTPDTHIVPDFPFFLGPECLWKPEWDVHVCPYKYTQIIISGEGGVLDSPLKKLYPLHVSRDDEPDSVITLRGVNHLKYPMRVNKSYTIKFNTTLGDVPKEVKVKAKFGLTENDIIRFAICFPRSTTTWHIKSTVPKINSDGIMPVWVDSLEDLDADLSMMAYFWDAESGYMYFKLSSNESFSRLNQEYPGDAAREVTITRLDGDDNPTDCDFQNPPFEYQNPNREAPAKVQAATCGEPDSPEGLGAPIRQSSYHSAHRVEQCPVADEVFVTRTREPRGCFLEVSLLSDFEPNFVDLKKSMTPEVCINRCFQRGLPFAGLYQGSDCQCAYHIGSNGALDLSESCDKVCSGDDTRLCGGNSEEAFFYTTGAELQPAPARCGPFSGGEVYEDSCLFVIYNPMEFWSAETVCNRLGGSLARIDTAEKMRFIERYLRNVDGDVWFGAKGTDEATWHHLDDEPLTYFNWRNDPVEAEDGRYLYLQEYRRFRWEKSPHYRPKMSLCEFPKDADSHYFTVADGNCGYNNQGVKYGTLSLCFARVDIELDFWNASLACAKMFGRMAAVHNETEKADIEAFLNLEADGERYWVEGTPSQEGYQKGYDESSKSRSLIELEEEDSYWALCVLDQEDINGCPSGWHRGGDSCYLDTGVTTNSFFKAAALCQSGTMSVLAADTVEEIEYVRNITSGQAWTDFRYSSALDDIVHTGGGRPASDLWAAHDPLQNLSNGLCVVVDLDTGTWTQTPCRDGVLEYKAICKMHTVDFDKTVGCFR